MCASHKLFMLFQYIDLTLQLVWRNPVIISLQQAEILSTQSLKTTDSIKLGSDVPDVFLVEITVKYIWVSLLIFQHNFLCVVG